MARALCHREHPSPTKGCTPSTLHQPLDTNATIVIGCWYNDSSDTKKPYESPWPARSWRSVWLPFYRRNCMFGVPGMMACSKALALAEPAGASAPGAGGPSRRRGNLRPRATDGSSVCCALPPQRSSSCLDSVRSAVRGDLLGAGADHVPRLHPVSPRRRSARRAARTPFRSGRTPVGRRSCRCLARLPRRSCLAVYPELRARRARSWRQRHCCSA